MIGFDARAAFLDPHRGFGRIARSLATALLGEHPGEIVVFVPRAAHVPPEWYPLAREIVQLRRPRHGAFLFDPAAWRATLARTPVAVLHLPAWGVPPFLPVPVVATFHDATPFIFRSPRSWRQRVRARLGISSLTRATLVHAVSQHAAGELARFVPVAAEKIRVVHWGVGPPFRPAAAPSPPRHVLYVGGGEPHKNLRVVVEALLGSDLPPLLVVGPASSEPAVGALLAPLVAQHKARVTAAVDDETLATLYQQALATVVPSRNEGFGLPALEAMACGCPVVASRCGALPEVCGDAAVLLDPDDVGAWRSALETLRRDPNRRTAVAEAGSARAARFGWDRCAEGIAALYREAARRESSSA